MTTALLPLPIFRCFDSAGLPGANFRLYTYVAGSSSTNQVTYGADGVTPNTNPVIMDSTGSATIRLDSSLAYKFVLKDASDNLSPSGWTEDNYSVPATSAASIGALLYPITTAETAAAVTPTNYQYPPGDIRRYGGVGDNSTDNTTALKNWALSATKGLRLTLEPSGTYLFTPSAAALGVKFASVAGFMIQGNGATIKAVAGAAVAGGCQMLYFDTCSDFLVQNLVIDGNRANRSISSDVTAANIQITTSCSNGKFQRVRSINACEDGWYVNTATEGTQSTYPTDITLEDCEAFNAYRNGLSLIGTLRFTVRGGYYHGTIGTVPESGIDIEPNSTTTFGNQDTVIDGPTCSDNNGYGLTGGVSAGAFLNLRTTVRNIRGTNNVAGFVRFGSAFKGINLDGLWCGPHSAVTQAMLYLASSATNTDIVLRNLHFSDITAAQSGSKALIYLHGTITERVMIAGLHVRNSTLQVLAGEAPVFLTDFDIRTVTNGIGNGAINYATSSNCVFRNGRIETCDGYGMIVANPSSIIEDVVVIDCASTVASIYLTSGATNPIVRNVSVIQNTAIPAGQKAIRFDAAPKVLTNFTATSAGTDYTSANAISLTAGVTGSLIQNCQPPPPIQTIASAATITLPRVGNAFIISGVTNVTSIVATNWDGQTVALIFSGVLTFTDGSNLKLSANFVTTADDGIMVACDGTNWYEVGARSIN